MLNPSPRTHLRGLFADAMNTGGDGKSAQASSGHAVARDARPSKASKSRVQARASNGFNGRSLFLSSLDEGRFSIPTWHPLFALALGKAKYWVLLVTP
jgi:hypothetical protein